MARFFDRLFGRRHEAARAKRVRLGSDVQAGGSDPEELSTSVLYGALLVLAFLVIMHFLFPGATAERGMELRVGQVAGEEIVAPFDFVVMKSADQLRQERAMAEADVISVYRFSRQVQTDRRTRMGDLLARIYDIRAGAESDRQKHEMLGQLGVALSDTTRQILLDPERSGLIEERARVILHGLYERGIIPEKGHPPFSGDQTVALLKDDREGMERVSSFFREEGLPALLEREAEVSFAEPTMRTAVRELVAPFLAGNVIYDSEETQSRKAVAREAVSDTTGIDVKKDELIIERGQRITDDDINIVHSMDVRRAELLLDKPGPERHFPAIGRFLSAALLLGVLILYAGVRRKRLFLDLRSQILFFVVLAIVMIGAAVVSNLTDASEYVYLVPVAVLSMLVALLFDFEIAIVTTFVTVLLTALYTGFGLPYVLVSIVGGTVAAHSVRRVRDREDFYWSGIRVVAAYALAIFVMDIAKIDVGLDTLTRCGWGGLNAIVSMGIVVVSLPLFERGFRVTTDITLLELADMNKPLLRKMAMTAPGSYHHSIVVGNLAEAAADAVRANGLLARVGSYYHDIGKLVGPGYFVENQQGLDPEDSKHATIKPKMSSMVLKAHVKDGVELARKEGLPEPIVDIIREHHGTSVMEFFYNKAREAAEDPDDVGAGEYSYPGPRARSRESAIIALADTIEARIRSITEPLTPKRIDAEIDAVIEKRWRDHQLDDAELTLSDLTKIRDAFFRVLAGMYHQRVKYPDQDGDVESAPDDDSGTSTDPDTGGGSAPVEGGGTSTESASETGGATGTGNGHEDHRQTEEDRDR